MVEQVMAIDVDDSKRPEMNNNDDDDKRKCLKRKRASVASESLSTEERETRIKALNEELDGLFKYYKEVLDQKLGLENVADTGNSAIACCLEESSLPLSKLVDEIYQKLRDTEGNGGLTLASVKCTVLLIGQRSFYGVPNADADVLEDDSQSCLWCWETRDVKLLPRSTRGVLKIRRTCRKKIHERITAVSGMITALQKLESQPNCRRDFIKASERLGKILAEADIRLLLEGMVQKNGANMAEKEVVREEKLLLKQLERSKREEEKEKKRLDREIQKEKLQSEKELKRLQDEAEKEERRREKEESEMRKQLKKQQEEAEKDQRRREKEEAELKKQLSLQKQASLMERFLKRSKNNLSSLNDLTLKKAITSESSLSDSKRLSISVTLSMDSVLSQNNANSADDIWKLHLISWHQVGQSIRSNRKQSWGIRQKPKRELVKEIKLTKNRGQACDDEINVEKLVDGWDEMTIDGRSSQANADSCPTSWKKHNPRKQLLQFDKSYRPAFYGIWPKKSQVVGPRRPFMKDPDLDYEIDSDEEWQEEEPGESLSDCDKDGEEESLEEACSKGDDEDESEDGFFVPDGYLSEDEGVQVDRMESDHLVEDARNSPSEQPGESDEFSLLLQQQKYLNNLTEHALQKNQPLIITNFMHEKASLLLGEDLTGIPKLEQTCLQALIMFSFPGGPTIEIMTEKNEREEDQEHCSCSMGNNTPVPTTTILDSDLLQIVSVIQSSSQGVNKLAELLQQKFPVVSRSQLRNKIREISNFMDNRWQVKKDILEKFGLFSSPEKSGARTKSIATFFSKRCMPPSGKTVNPSETSPQSSQKSVSVVQLQQGFSDNHP